MRAADVRPLVSVRVPARVGLLQRRRMMMAATLPPTPLWRITTSRGSAHSTSCSASAGAELLIGHR